MTKLNLIRNKTIAKAIADGDNVTSQDISAAFVTIGLAIFIANTSLTDTEGKKLEPFFDLFIKSGDSIGDVKQLKAYLDEILALDDATDFEV